MKKSTETGPIGPPKPAEYFRKGDFIPFFIGAVRYTRRNLGNVDKENLDEEGYAIYFKNTMPQEFLLSIYNLTVLAGTIAGAVGLEKLLS